MPAAMAQPAWSVLALIIAAIGLALQTLFRVRHSRRWRIACVMLPLLGAASAALGLAGIAVTRTPDVVILLDLSPSARANVWRSPAWVQALIEKRLGNRHVTVVAFADTQQVVFNGRAGDGRWPSQWPEFPGARGTNIRAALAWRTPDEQRDGNHLHDARWVITDGLFSADAVKQNPGAAWTIVPADGVDAGVVDLRLRTAGLAEKREVEIMAQVRVTAPSAARGLLGARITFERDGVALGEQTVDVSIDADRAAEPWISMRDTLEGAAAGVPHRYEAGVELLNGKDPWPENNRASMIWSPPDGAKILAIGAKKPDVPAAAFVSTADFFASPNRLVAEGWQAIILNDVPGERLEGGADSPNPLPERAANILASLVENDGTGLLLLSDGHAFGPGHYGESAGAASELERLSPVWSHPEKGDRMHAIFVLDASASMNEVTQAGPGHGPLEKKFAVAAAGVVDACRLLSPEDRVTVVTFNKAAKVVADGAKQVVWPLDKLLAVAPGGATVPDAALEAIRTALAEQTSGQNLVIFLTDGEIPAIDVARWQAMLANAHARLVIIAPPGGAAPRPSVLEQLARMPGSVWFKAADPAEWDALLHEAVAEQVRGTVQDVPLEWHGAAEARGRNLSGWAGKWTRTWRKPEAVVLAEGTEDVPVAAVAQRGLGKVGAITISPDASAAYRALVERTLQEIAAAPGDRRFTLAAVRQDGGWLVTADGIDEHGFIDGDSLAATVLSADATPGELLPLTQTSPGHYEAMLQNAGSLAVTVLRDKPAGRELVGRLQVPAIETAEWPASVSDPLDGVAVARLAAHSAVTFLPASLSDSTRWSIPQRAPFSLSPILWMLSAMAALAALWLRK